MNPTLKPFIKTRWTSVVELFDRNSSTHKNILENQINEKINDTPKQNQLIEILQNRNGFLLPML